MKRVSLIGNTAEHFDCQPVLLEGNKRNVGGATGHSPSSERLIDLSPPDLLSRNPDLEWRVDSGECAWLLAHTLPRQEKALARALLARGIAYYLPLVEHKSLTRGRPRMARLPLFPGYVFVFGTDEDRLGALQTNRLLTVQRVDDGEQLRMQLRTFADFIAAGVPLTRESQLTGGEHVRIKAGPFRDTEGVVLRRNGRTELLIAIDFLRQGAALEIDDCMLEPI